MPTTPISVSTGIQGVTNTTIYTVPVGRTAIVKAVSGLNVSAGAVSLTVSKNVGGQNFVVVNNQTSNFTPATGGTERFNENVLNAPLTMAANEQLKVYTATTNRYALPNVATGGTVADDGTNYGIYANVFANSIYMVAGYYGGGAYIATSPDAITWTQRTAAAPFYTQITILSCNGSIWVGTNLNDSQGTVVYSSDNGVTWGLGIFVAGSINVKSLINNGSTFLLSASNDKIYSSTNGSTWTDVTSYTTAHAGSGGGINNLAWTGTHWIVANNYGALASTNLTTWLSYAGVSLGRNISDIFSTSYSTAYSKYYSARNLDNVPNIFSSTNGLLWETLSSGAITPFKINCAGANTVLIGVPSSGGTTVYRSTDGATFASATTQGGYAGPMIGLDNGVFLTMLNNGTNDSCMLSTDPTVTTGTTRGTTIGSFILNSAAADPVSGKWIGIGKTATLVYAIGGTGPTDIGTAYNTTFTVAAAGIPSSICWSAVDGYFYMVTDTGRVYRTQQYGSGWTFQGLSGVSGATASIKAVGTTLYIASSSHPSSIFTSSTLNNGSAWTERSCTTPNPYAYRNIGNVNAGGYYYGIGLATDGTNLVWNNQTGNAFAVTPSVSIAGMRMPFQRAVGTVQTLNSNQFMYAGSSPLDYGGQYGMFTSTNLTTTYGTFLNLDANVGAANTLPNKFNYVGGVYYLTNVAVNGNIYNGTTPTNIFNNFAGTGASYAGISTVAPGNGWMIDGANLVSTGQNGKLNAVCKTSTPSNFLYAATVTASIVEIS